MTTSEPTTGEIVRALRCSADDDSFCKECQYGYALAHEFFCDLGRMNGNAADRLESLQRENVEKDAQIEAQGKEMVRRDTIIKELTARAEQSECERDAAKADMKLIVDAVRETHCDETCCFACKYDCDMSINDSGEFNNECPGFDRDDCFEWRGLPQAGEESR